MSEREREGQESKRESVQECGRKWREKEGNSRRNGGTAGTDRGGVVVEDCRVVLVESWGIDSGPFDMLIRLLTALIAPSSHRGLQSEDAFQKDERGEERREERREEESRGEMLSSF